MFFDEEKFVITFSILFSVLVLIFVGFYTYHNFDEENYAKKIEAFKKGEDVFCGKGEAWYMIVNKNIGWTIDKKSKFFVNDREAFDIYQCVLP